MTADELSRKKVKEHLEQIFEKKNIISKELYLLTYSTDASQIKGKAKFVVFPKEKEEIRRLIVFSARYGIPLVPRGGGTNLVGSAVPNDSIIVDFSRMTKIISFDRSNKRITIQPGIILSRLNSYLKNFNLFFPVNPSSRRVCTIGGMVSTDAVGSRALKYGRTSDNIEQLEFIDGTGQSNKQSNKLFFGSEGIYGMLVEVTLSLKEIPENRSLSIFESDDIDEVLKVTSELKEDPEISAIEFMDKQASSMINLSDNYHLVVEFENASGDIKKPEEMKKVWDTLDSFKSTFADKDLDVIEDPQVPEEKIKEFVSWCEFRELPCFGHLGTGVMHVHFNHKQKKLIDKMLIFVKSLGGEVSGEHGIGILKKSYLEKNIKNRINSDKKGYDPNNIMNPGKIVGRWSRQKDW